MNFGPYILFDVGVAALVLAGILLYFLPSIVAFFAIRGNMRRVLVLNVLLGWTVIGWVAALVDVIRHDATRGVARR